MTNVIPETAPAQEHVSLPHFITLCGIPQEAIDCIWEANMLAEWSETDPVPAPPSLALAQAMATRQSSLRALGASMRDAAWLESFASSTLVPGLEGLAMNALLPDQALATIANKNPGLVQHRIDALTLLKAHQCSATNAEAVAAALVAARAGHAIAAALNGADAALAEALHRALVNANGGTRDANVRLVRAALIATGHHDDLLVAVATSSTGVIDTALVQRLFDMVANGTVPREALKARAHAEAVGMVRRLGLHELAPLRQRQPMTKEAQDVLDQFEVFALIDPTPAARRAIRWWPSLDQADVSRILDAADVETIVDWCQGAMQVAPDADEVVELLSRLGAEKFDAFCEEVTRRPDPTEEQAALSLALRDPMQHAWRPAGIHAAVKHLCDELSSSQHWHTAVALLANGWKPTMWELAACAKQV
jgi:hypothetical protein